MKTIAFYIGAFFLISTVSCAQINLGKLKEKAKETVGTGGETKLSNDEIIGGLKEALTVGTENSTKLASKVDGFYKNKEIMLPFPEDAKKMETKLREIGMGDKVDEFIMTLNRAAEEAAKEAAPIFVEAIKGMSIGDGMTILKGEDNAATTYLKDNTSSSLHEKFKPIIQAALKKVQITKYWEPLMTAYNKIPFVEKIETDLEEYTTQKAMAGLFTLIAKEELKIRQDPMARVSDLLKKVFGN